MIFISEKSVIQKIFYSRVQSLIGLIGEVSAIDRDKLAGILCPAQLIKRCGEVLKTGEVLRFVDGMSVFVQALVEPLVQGGIVAVEEDGEDGCAAFRGQSGEVAELVVLKIGLEDECITTASNKIGHKLEGNDGEFLILFPICRRDIVTEDLLESVLVDDGEVEALADHM